MNGGGLRIIGSGLKWFDQTIIGGLEQSGGGACLEKLNIVVFFAKHVSLIVMLLIHAMMNSGSVECTSCNIFLCLFRNYVSYHLIAPKIDKRGLE